MKLSNFLNVLNYPLVFVWFNNWLNWVDVTNLQVIKYFLKTLSALGVFLSFLEVRFSFFISLFESNDVNMINPRIISILQD